MSSWGAWAKAAEKWNINLWIQVVILVFSLGERYNLAKRETIKQ